MRDRIRHWLVLLLPLLAVLVLTRAVAAAEGDDELEEVLPPIEITAPSARGGPKGAPPSQVALRRETPVQEVPRALDLVDASDIQLRRPARSLSGALEGLPGVLVQKTGPLQHSPYVRGFTGYQNLLLIDGIRLNNSTFRAGPNQYWATVDALSVASLEVVRGPHSVLYGSDAIGGTVNVRPWRRECFACGDHLAGGFYMRLSSAERAAFFRTRLEGNRGGFGFAAGVGYKTYGDLEAGSGRLPGTGDPEEWDADLRFDHQLTRYVTTTIAWQRVRQLGAPRTEQTIDSVSFRGTRVGSELQRNFDQQRDLVYARLAYDDGCTEAQVTASWHRQEEKRNRLRTGDRRDLQGFTVNQYGLQAQVSRKTRLGRFTLGADYYRDEVSSFRNNFVGGALTSTNVQGPVGDDATYDLLGAYAQHEWTRGALTVIGGARFTYAAASAGRVDNPLVAGSDPATPGNVISVDNDWTNVVGSLRAKLDVRRDSHVFAGVSQAFRAPSLHDLTSFDDTSVVETPAPDLDSEQYLSFEGGLRTQNQCFSGTLAGWYTVLDGTIVRSPTGALIGGTPEVRKDNIGDGHVWGLEADGIYRFRRNWSVLGAASYMDGEVDQLDTAGTLVRRPLSRMKPFSTLLGLRFEPPQGRFWAQAEWQHVEREDRLSFRDEADTRRIPAGGTPGYDVFHLRMGFKVTPKVNASLSVENVLNENFRVHGSGQNEPGANCIFALDIDL